MVFSSRKTPKPTSSQEKSTPPKKGLAGLLKRKNKHDEAHLKGNNNNADLSRILRASKIKTSTSEEKQLDKMVVRDTLESIESALYAMDQVRDILQQCFEIAVSAKNTEELGARALLAESYDELRDSLNRVVEETDGYGDALIGHEAQNIEIEMVGRARYCVTAFPISPKKTGLDLSPPLDAFDNDEEIIKLCRELKLANNRVKRVTASYCTDAKVLMKRLEECSHNNKEEVTAVSNTEPTLASA